MSAGERFAIEVCLDGFWCAILGRERYPKLWRARLAKFAMTRLGGDRNPLRIVRVRADGSREVVS